jgi:hypothetical protein
MSKHRRIALVLLVSILLAALAGVAQGRSGVDPNAAAVRQLGVSYGPYMGLRCKRPTPKPKCETIGIDVVFGRRAAKVVAVAGSQRVVLRTPGRHDGVRFRDWVGNFTHAGIAPGHYPHGANFVRVPVTLYVHFADGRRAHARFPGVLVNPGWG